MLNLLNKDFKSAFSIGKGTKGNYMWRTKEKYGKDFFTKWKNINKKIEIIKKESNRNSGVECIREILKHC